MKKSKFSVKLHSFIGLITNSSTEFFVDHSDSLEPCKDMLAEILSLMGSNAKVDDIFDVSIIKEDDEQPARLQIEVKDPQYEGLAKKVLNFIGSVEAIEMYR